MTKYGHFMDAESEEGLEETNWFMVLLPSLLNAHGDGYIFSQWVETKQLHTYVTLLFPEADS